MSIKKTIVVTGVGTAVLLGGGAAALAASTAASSSTTPTTSSSAHVGAASSTKSTAATARRKAEVKDLRGLLRRSDSVTWVTGGHGKFKAVTHDAIRGHVVAVSARSIRVESPGKTFQTYAVSANTRVHVKAAGKGKAGTIGQVKTGDRVVVIGTGTNNLTARRVLDAGVMKTTTAKASSRSK